MAGSKPMLDVFRIADILVEHAQRVHGDEIAIIAYYGSRAKGLASPTSDLDIFYIPDEGKAETLCSQFIIDGLPYDFWPVSWAMAEEIADARSSREWAISASLIADAKVLHHRSQADLERFNDLQTRIDTLTKPESHPAMVERTLDGFKGVLFHLGQMRLAMVNDDGAGFIWSSNRLAQSTINCLALINQIYFSKGWVGALSETDKLLKRPANFQERIRSVVMAGDPQSKIEIAENLALDVRNILRTEQNTVGQVEPATVVFKDFYFFVFEYANKVRSACHRGDGIAAGAAAIQMQEQICQLLCKVEQGFYPAEFFLFGEYVDSYTEAGFPDLLEPAAEGDLEEIERRVEELDAKMRLWMTGQGISLDILEDEEALRAFLQARDPLPKPT
jgi:hypothetical protein